MTLQATVDQKLRDAQKSRAQGASDAELLATISVLKMAKTRFMEAETAGKERISLDDAQAEAVLRKMAKSSREAAQEYAEHGAADRAAQENLEARILEQLLPKQLDEDETRAVVAEIVAGLDNPNIGAVMGQLKSRTDIDKGVASRIVRELI